MAGRYNTTLTVDLHLSQIEMMVLLDDLDSFTSSSSTSHYVVPPVFNEVDSSTLLCVDIHFSSVNVHLSVKVIKTIVDNDHVDGVYSS